MKCFAAIFFVLGIGFFLSPYLFSLDAQAQQVCPAGFESLCNIRLENNPNMIGNIVKILIIIAIILSVIFLIIGGIRWTMSEGDKGKVAQARSTILAAIIGLIISLLAYFIVNMVLTMLGADIKSLNIPRLID